jgi:hypothetical protein
VAESSFLLPEQFVKTANAAAANRIEKKIDLVFIGLFILLDTL